MQLLEGCWTATEKLKMQRFQPKKLKKKMEHEERQ